MELPEKHKPELLKDLSHNAKGKLDEWIRKACGEFGMLEQFVAIALSDYEKSSWHSAWVLKHIAEEEGHLLAPYSPQIVQKLPTLSHSSQVGCLLWALHFLPVELDQAGHLLDHCLKLLAQEGHVAYLRLYAMEMIWRFAQYEPLLIPELKASLEQHSIYFEKAYLKKRTREIISAMTKLWREQ